jgi:hypothetical protein
MTNEPNGYYACHKESWRKTSLGNILKHQLQVTTMWNMRSNAPKMADKDSL